MFQNEINTSPCCCCASAKTYLRNGNLPCEESIQPTIEGKNEAHKSPLALIFLSVSIHFQMVRSKVWRQRHASKESESGILLGMIRKMPRKMVFYAIWSQLSFPIRKLVKPSWKASTELCCLTTIRQRKGRLCLENSWPACIALMIVAVFIIGFFAYTPQIPLSMCNYQQRSRTWIACVH